MNHYRSRLKNNQPFFSITISDGSPSPAAGLAGAGGHRGHLKSVGLSPGSIKLWKYLLVITVIKYYINISSKLYTFFKKRIRIAVALLIAAFTDWNKNPNRTRTPLQAPDWDGASPPAMAGLVWQLGLRLAGSAGAVLTEDEGELHFWSFTGALVHWALVHWAWYMANYPRDTWQILGNRWSCHDVAVL